MYDPDMQALDELAEEFGTDGTVHVGRTNQIPYRIFSEQSSRLDVHAFASAERIGWAAAARIPALEERLTEFLDIQIPHDTPVYFAYVEVDPDHRQQGVARAMLPFIRDFLQDKHALHVERFTLDGYFRIRPYLKGLYDHLQVTSWTKMPSGQRGMDGWMCRQY